MEFLNTLFLICLSDPYVKVSLLNDGKLTKHFKSKVLLETNNPQVNEMFEFYISQVTLVHFYFNYFLRDWSRFTRCLGRILENKLLRPPFFSRKHSLCPLIFSEKKQQHLRHFTQHSLHFYLRNVFFFNNK